MLARLASQRDSMPKDVFLVSGENLSNSKIVLQLEQDLLKELSLTPQPAAPVLEIAPH
jgi:hypothetical protein